MSGKKTTSGKNGQSDGRQQRGERNRKKILDATLALIEEGNLVPSAPEVSERACVGLRTVFRHFDDKEGLSVQMEEHLGDTHDKLFDGGDREGSLPERILHAAQCRDRAYARAKNVILSTQVQLWQSETLRKLWAIKRRNLRRDLHDWLPEVKSLSPPRQAAAETATSFETWYQLRNDQGLTHKAIVAAISEVLCLLLEVEPA